MPLFGEASTPYDEAIEKVTAETLTAENWVLMMEINDRVANDGAKGAKQCLLGLKKRLNHRDPHVVLFALSLLDCLWNNSSIVFRREVSSNDFINELTYRATGSNRVVAEKTRLLIKKWTENECKRDTSLSLVESLYRELLNEGYTFDADEPKRKTVQYSNDPNVVSTEQEEADIAKAIALSLNQNKSSFNASPMMQTQKQDFRANETVIRQVRAMYDFEAAESNEITFSAGDIINVFECSDANWWRGQHSRGGISGLFPASFVSLELRAPPEDAVAMAVRNEEARRASRSAPVQKQRVQIDEAVLTKCIDIFEQCDPTGITPDAPELAYYEQMSAAQAPLIDQKLAQIDKQHNMLAQVDIAIRDVLASYDSAIQQTHPGAGAASSSQQPTRQQSNVTIDSDAGAASNSAA